jgi:hypothetical protein
MVVLHSHPSMVLRYGFHVERWYGTVPNNFLCNYAAVTDAAQKGPLRNSKGARDHGKGPVPAVDDSLLEALEDYVKRQRKRLKKDEAAN